MLQRERQRDIEVYLRGVRFDRAREWIERILGLLTRVDDGCDAGHQIHHAFFLEHTIPIMLTEMKDAFTSVWFNSPHTPWPTDLACARQAAADLGVEVRCDPGDGSPSDLFLRIRGSKEDLITQDD